MMSAGKSSSQPLQKVVSSMWTAGQVDILITTVRGHESLYDQTNANYSNREVVDQIWHLVANQLGKTAKECSKKWQLLRAGYRKRRHSDAPSGSGAKKVKKWVFFYALTFLATHMVERETIINLEASAQSYITDSEGFLQPVPLEEEETQVELLEVETTNAEEIEIIETIPSSNDISDEESETPSTVLNQTARTPSVPKKWKKKEDVDKEFSNYLQTISAKNRETVKRSAMEHFLLSCVDEANALSLPAQRNFKIKVIQILSELSDS